MNVKAVKARSQKPVVPPSSVLKGDKRIQTAEGWKRSLLKKRTEKKEGGRKR